MFCTSISGDTLRDDVVLALCDLLVVGDVLTRRSFKWRAALLDAGIFDVFVAFVLARNHTTLKLMLQRRRKPLSLLLKVFRRACQYLHHCMDKSTERSVWTSVIALEALRKTRDFLCEQVTEGVTNAVDDDQEARYGFKIILSNCDFQLKKTLNGEVYLIFRLI